ncbi:putative mitochondrial export translocase Oxa2 [Aspergillus clavatus NRRL 1]|uniref:Mitochondrial export translocase Oxa2, putative n=1 Tax=Aspergillus clavatus (strain ATCC 1007 / CBS 513.65 / DSM 816 / NCTC 3887 / NRRL 1 / QM 1276 / 107) TaxID=344612 RepID=A1CQX3_ASPCL|nr:mitochondrial export translocase Oxa2, putative [Aspergillus clavatus NRRL 1]EAW08044.1 mitochondrial export translocase Oxa2, putative [Aspergillus clavatus NRRL 1]
MRPFRPLLRSPHTAGNRVAQQKRHFHPTRPSPFINEVLEVSSGFIHGVHSISGLPWVMSIPLTALIVRTTVAMPLQIYTKMQARKERDIVPLIYSWKKHYQDQIKKRIDTSNDTPILPRDARRELAAKVKDKKKELHKRWNVPRFWKPVGFLQIPIWISVMESLRAMSGNNKGLVPYLLSLTEPTTAEPSTALHLAVEPSLATEGALWFPDLLAGDPTGILPAALTLSILLNIRAGWTAPRLSELADLPRIEIAQNLAMRSLRLLVQVLALNIGASSYIYEMPSALMIYWISSTNIATLQTLLLDKFIVSESILKPWRQIHIGYTQSEQKAAPVK